MSTMERTAWLFTRDQQSVRIELRATSGGVELLIEGPGPTTSRHDFPEGTSVDGFRQEYEQKLLDDGYKLQAVAERRGGVTGRSGVEERRRRD
jgi:hypothetical protein